MSSPSWQHSIPSTRASLGGRASRRGFNRAMVTRSSTKRRLYHFDSLTLKSLRNRSQWTSSWRRQRRDWRRSCSKGLKSKVVVELVAELQRGEIATPRTRWRTSSTTPSTRKQRRPNEFSFCFLWVRGIISLEPKHLRTSAGS